jgi:hypothetical protein
LGSIERHTSDSKAQTIQTKTCLVSIIWSTSGIHTLLALRAGMRDDGEFFCAFGLADIEKNLCDGKHRKMLRGAYIHLDYAPAHKANRSRQEIARTKATRVVYPSHSPDAAPNDFFSFGDLKGEMPGFTANSPADILSEIHQIFQEISKKTFVAVHDEWITEHKKACYHLGEKKSGTLSNE